jgi:UTP--glucose-1-phosphate uridylyltransferase
MLERMRLLAVIMAAVEDALLVAGGLGTRMYPASAYLPKEALPLLDIPVLLHLAHEAIAAGVKRIHIISSPSKDLSLLLQDKSHLHDKRPELDKKLFSTFSNIDVQVHLQVDPLGLGDAISCALDQVKGPFLVLLGDNIILDNHTTTKDFTASNASKKLVESFEQYSLPCCGILPVPQEDVSNYGVVELEGNLIKNIVEKPKQEDAPSNLVLCGRYIFPLEAKKLLKEVYKVEEFGEFQSIEIQKHWMRNNGFIGVELQGFNWYDSGNPLSWLQAQVDHALRRPDYAEEFRSWLETRLN